MKRLAYALLCCAMAAAATPDHRLSIQVRPYVPPSIQTLGAAAQYLIEPSGYRIAAQLADGRNAGTLLHARITPPRDLAPIALSDALLRLVPAHIGIVIDPSANTVAFAVVQPGDARVRVIAPAPVPEPVADIDSVAGDLLPTPVAPAAAPRTAVELEPVDLANGSDVPAFTDAPIGEPVDPESPVLDATPLPTVAVMPPALRLEPGERLSDQLARAATGAGFQMVWRAHNDAEIEAASEFEGATFPEQLEAAFRALWKTQPFYFDEYSNHVLIIQDAAP